MKYILFAIGAFLLIGWSIGFALHVAGALIHILLVVAVISIAANIIMVRRA